jgi:hypothetical protein
MILVISHGNGLHPFDNCTNSANYFIVYTNPFTEPIKNSPNNIDILSRSMYSKPSTCLTQLLACLNLFENSLIHYRHQNSADFSTVHKEYWSLYSKEKFVLKEKGKIKVRVIYEQPIKYIFLYTPLGVDFCVMNMIGLWFVSYRGCILIFVLPYFVIYERYMHFSATFRLLNSYRQVMEYRVQNCSYVLTLKGKFMKYPLYNSCVYLNNLLVHVKYNILLTYKLCMLCCFHMYALYINYNEYHC